MRKISSCSKTQVRRSILFVQFEVLLHYFLRSEVRGQSMCCPEALQQAGGGFVRVVRGPDDSETEFMF